jgi:hypothetical protein
MTWTNISVKPSAELSYIKNSEQILLGQASERDPSLESKQHCEFLVKNKQTTLLICIGDEWTWGEKLMPEYDSRQLDSNFPHEWHPTLILEDTWAAKLARFLNTDLWLHAVPYNTNEHMLAAVSRILKDPICQTYQQVKLVYSISQIPTNINVVQKLNEIVSYSNLNIEYGVWTKYDLPKDVLSFTAWAAKLHGTKIADVDTKQFTQELSELSEHHPNRIGHFLWAIYLAKKFKWKTL